MVATSRLEMLGDSEVTADQLVKGGLGGVQEAAGRDAHSGGCAPLPKATIVPGEGERVGILRPTPNVPIGGWAARPPTGRRDPETGQLGTAIWRLPK